MIIKKYCNKFGEERMKKKSFEFKLSMSYIILLIISFIVFLTKGNYKKIAVVALCFGTLILVYLVIYNKKIIVPGILYSLSIIFCFMAQYVGNALDIYHVIPYWDKILHLGSGFILAMLGYVIYLNLVPSEERKRITKWMGPLFSFLFATACAGIWEIYEFAVDNLLGMLCQNNSLKDTMFDIISGTGTGLFIAALILISNFKRPIWIIKKIEDDVDKKSI